MAVTGSVSVTGVVGNVYQLSLDYTVSRSSSDGKVTFTFGVRNYRTGMGSIYGWWVRYGGTLKRVKNYGSADSYFPARNTYYYYADSAKSTSATRPFTATVTPSSGAAGTANVTIEWHDYGSSANNGNIVSESYFGWHTATFALDYPANSTYTIKLDGNGGSYGYSSRSAYYGYAVSFPSPHPSKSNGSTSRTINFYGNGGTSDYTRSQSGYYPWTFYGWGTSASTTTVSYYCDTNYVINADKTLYALYSQGSTTYNGSVTSPSPSRSSTTGSRTTYFDGNGGTTSKTSQTASRTTTYSFDGWYTAASGGSYIVGAKTSFTPSATSYYAHWSSSTGSYGAITFPTATQCTRTGYTLSGWSNSSTATTATYAPGDSQVVSGTWYAVWQLNSWTISYDANGGSSTPSSQTKYYGQDLTLRESISRDRSPLSDYTITYDATTNGGTTSADKWATDRWTYYTFSSWKATDGTTYAASASYKANEATTMTAQWSSRVGGTTSTTLPTASKSNSYSYRYVSYDINYTGGTNPNQSTSTRTTTYSMNGWYSAASGGTKYGNANASYTPTSSVTAYAQFTSSTGSWTSVTLPTPANRSGYKFNGWAETSTAASGLAAGSSYTPSKTITLYGTWEALNPTLDSVSVGRDRTSATLSFTATFFGSKTQKGYSCDYGTTSSYGTNISETTTSTSISLTGLIPNTTYYYRIRVQDSADLWSNYYTGSFTTTGNAPIINSMTLTPARTTMTIGMNVTYDTNASFQSRTVYYGTDGTNFPNTITGTSLSDLKPNTLYYFKATVTDNWSRISNMSNVYSEYTKANAPTITGHGLSVNGANDVELYYNATYDTNTALSSWSWVVDGVTYTETNQIHNLEPDTTYSYTLTVTNNAHYQSSSSATGQFTTEHATQEVKDIVITNLTETSIQANILLDNPTYIDRLEYKLYLGNELIYETTRSTDIGNSNTVLFENLIPNTAYVIRARVRTISSANRWSGVFEKGAVTLGSWPFVKVNSDGSIKKYKGYALGSGSIFNPSRIKWQAGHYVGSMGANIDDSLDSLNNEDICSAQTVPILPSTDYLIKNNSEFNIMIIGTDNSGAIVDRTIIIQAGRNYTLNTVASNIYINVYDAKQVAQGYYLDINIFRSIARTLIDKENIIYLNGKIRYIDIIQGGNSVDDTSTVLELEVYDKAGANIALNKDVKIIQGNSADDPSIITNGNQTGSYVTINPVNEEILETIVRVDLGEEYTNIDHIKLWRFYSDNRVYYNTRLFGRDADKRLTWKFQSYKIDGTYPETRAGFTSQVFYEADLPPVEPVIKAVDLDPSTDTNDSVEITINARLEEV